MWYAAQVHSNAEARVSQYLGDRRIQNFWPHTTRVDERKREFHRPFFPGYVFVSSDLTSNQCRRDVLTVPHVVRIIGVGTEPEPIPDIQVESVRRVAEYVAERARQVAIIPTAGFHSGDKIRIHKGPLAGVQGYVTWIRDELRLVVQVDMLGQAVSAEVDAEWLHVIEPCSSKS
jgi:transcription antitermination factor NusG